MLELKNISFTAEDNGSNIEIIRDISHTISDNKFVVITGPNGGGKSTLAKIIAGIQKNTGGQIILDGVDITDKSITSSTARRTVTPERNKQCLNLKIFSL